MGAGAATARRRAGQHEKRATPLRRAWFPSFAFGSGPIDIVNGRAERGFYILVGGIEQVSVGRRLQRGGGAAGIAGVARLYFGEDALVFNRAALGDQFVWCAGGPALPARR